jgi:hypothetical protein
LLRVSTSLRFQASRVIVDKYTKVCELIFDEVIAAEQGHKVSSLRLSLVSKQLCTELSPRLFSVAVFCLKVSHHSSSTRLAVFDRQDPLNNISADLRSRITKITMESPEITVHHLVIMHSFSYLIE